MKKLFFFSIIASLITFSACNKMDDFSPVPLSDYNLQTPGKYIIYKLDSISYADNGNRETISYFAKDLVDNDPIIDTLGRTGYRILHYLRKNETDPWLLDNTFFTFPANTSIEFVANNFRYVKLVSPINEGSSWKGNAYIETKNKNFGNSDLPDWDFSYLDDWDYIYQNVYQPLSFGDLSFDSTITVNEHDEVTNDTSDVNVYSEVNYSMEQYAKGIGLVYRKFLHQIWQPPSPSNNGYYTSDSYGITLTIIDHN